jgi:hypothetical protein
VNVGWFRAYSGICFRQCSRDEVAGQELLRMQFASDKRRSGTAPPPGPPAPRAAADTRIAVLRGILEGLLDTISTAAAAAEDASHLPQLLDACCTFAVCASAVAATQAAGATFRSAYEVDWGAAMLDSGEHVTKHSI